MIDDILVVARKELRELVRQRSSFASAGVLLAIFGALFPSRDGVAYLTQPTAIFSMAFIPFAVIVAFIADAFAGERERHTLESLLATRLPDRAILFGKIAAAVAWGWGLVWVEAAISLVVVNLGAHGAFAFYSAPVIVAGLGYGLLVALFMSSLGVLVSLRSATVKQAQQVLSIGVALVAAAIVGGSALLPSGTRRALGQFMATTGAVELLVLGALLLAAIDSVLMGLCLARFKRAKLILD